MAEQLKTLFHQPPPKPQRKDKLTQTKLRDRELKEAHRNELTAAKQRREKERQAELAEQRAERAYHDTKRSAADKRRAARKEAHAATGQLCEHGIWRCRICYPVHTHDRRHR